MLVRLLHIEGMMIMMMMTATTLNSLLLLLKYKHAASTFDPLYLCL